MEFIEISGVEINGSRDVKAVFFLQLALWNLCCSPHTESKVLLEYIPYFKFLE